MNNRWAGWPEMDSAPYSNGNFKMFFIINNSNFSNKKRSPNVGAIPCGCLFCIRLKI